MYITSYLWRFRFSHFPVLDSARFGNMHLIWQLESFPYLIEKYAIAIPNIMAAIILPNAIKR